MENIISSKDNSVIKLYQKLAVSKKERYTVNKFVLEGARLVGDALNEGAELSHLLITEFAMDKHSSILSQVDLKKVKVIQWKNYYLV